MAPYHFRSRLHNTGAPAPFKKHEITKRVFMTNSTLGRKARRTRVPMTTDLQPGPRASSIQAILGYSKALKVVNAPPVGEISLILN